MASVESVNKSDEDSLSGDSFGNDDDEEDPRSSGSTRRYFDRSCIMLGFFLAFRINNRGSWSRCRMAPKDEWNLAL